MRPFRKYKGDAAAVAYSSMSVRDYIIIIIIIISCRTYIGTRGLT